MPLPFIAILRGGYTGESVISLKSAQTMMDALGTDRFDAAFISVAREGWTCERHDGTVLPFDRGAFSADRGQGPERFAAALISIHGTPGEDGKLQGYLDMLKVPYQTGGVLNMALTMSKFSTTGLLRQMGFAVAPSLLLQGRDASDAQRVLDEVGLPCFIKPDNSGSSLGISKVKTAAELGPALDKAFAEDPTVMCEAFVQGRELTCGVIRMGGEVRALPICEIRTSHEFFDFEAKYNAADTEEIVPAPVPEHIATIVQERSVAIYRALKCNGMARIDHFWREGEGDGKEVVTIEVNTVPGFTPVSIFPKMLAAAGITIAEAVNGMVEWMIQPSR
ncbi:MAG: D-alanine--D-alanine ligase [Flavobacteriales bacterium]|nr:D-alanine--D-alanine ligase [Flavobacteriales bacterium]MBK6892723.1 D-alanine--D-alanine ligase [Flavobacteriales bacterium]MBK7246862.1 D-alanine--D-alanine ligase [Flavobacteriales bacterium]MBK7287230.1 D-alanine--D-alanine ligase [Flavobacteriales bacterium]MBK9061451.1 D-alanine--D-alanine ligase [Flavobacteriales bacterium]